MVINYYINNNKGGNKIKGIKLEGVDKVISSNWIDFTATISDL